MANPKTSRPGDPAVDNARIGTVIRGKWTVDALLGTGGMAVVYAASHRNGHRAALKILHASFGRDRIVCERFLREAYLSNKVNHSATVQVLDDDVTEAGEPFLVMELLEGETVREAWKKVGRTMPIGRVLQIAERVLDCLASCHAINVIHRDLKPANVFITREGEIKVLDFGVAQMRGPSSEHTATGTALGTPAYMSPEQAMGLVDQLDGRADLFSVGAMMHALVTGHRINTGKDEQEALLSAATKPAPSVTLIAPKLPAGLAGLIDKALSWDRRNRFLDARDMQRAVLELMPAEGVSPLPGRPSPRPSEVSVPPLDRIPSSSGEVSMPPAAPPMSPLVTTVPEEPPADEARRAVLVACFGQIEHVVAAARANGWTDEDTTTALGVAYDAVHQASRPEPIRVAVRPYGLAAGGESLWEPPAPLDAIPYNLFACGVRCVALVDGITIDELRDFLAILLLDPARDLLPEDDLATVVWEKGFAHVELVSADDFTPNDARSRERFFSEAAILEKAVMPVILANKPPRTPAPADVSRVELARGFAVARSTWGERYVDALVEGYVDATAKGDAAIILDSLRRSVSELVVSGRLDIAFSLEAAIRERLRQRLGRRGRESAEAMTTSMFGGETLGLVLRRIRDDARSATAFVGVLGSLGSSELPRILASLRTTTDPTLRAAFVAFIDRAFPTNEEAIALAVDDDIGALLVPILRRGKTACAREAIAKLAESDDPETRIEARMALAEPADSEIAALLEDATTRPAAVRVLVRHAHRPSWPTVARVIGGKGFSDLPSGERRDLLRACVLIAPERGEPFVLDIAKKGGMLLSDEREATRALAAELLGEHSRSLAIGRALQEIAESRWGTSDDTRMAAGTASRRIGERAAGAG